MFTIEAKCVTTFAISHRPFNKVWLLKDVVAAFLRAPFHIFIMVSHLLAMPVQVLLQIIDAIFWIRTVLQVFQEVRVRHYYVASCLRASSEYALSSILHLVLEHHHPAHPIELMSARERISPVHYIRPSFKFAIAYEAGVIIFRA